MTPDNQKDFRVKELTIEEMAKALVRLAVLANSFGFVVMIGGPEPEKK